MQQFGTSRREAVVAVAFRVACHILFVLGVGTMMVAMFFGMSRCLGRLAAP